MKVNDSIDSVRTKSTNINNVYIQELNLKDKNTCI